MFLFWIQGFAGGGGFCVLLMGIKEQDYLQILGGSILIIFSVVGLWYLAKEEKKRMSKKHDEKT